MAKSSSSRRSHRRLRVTVAALILAAATAVTVPALVTQSVLWLTVAAVVALVCGVVATRIVYTDMVHTRRETAADRARQADAYRLLFAERARENVDFADSMAKKVASRDRTIGELEGTIRLAEKRADVAETRAKKETLRADDATLQLSNLQRQLQISDPELIDDLAAWEGTDLDTVIDLMSWEEKVIAKGDDVVLEEQKQA